MVEWDSVEPPNRFPFTGGKRMRAEALVGTQPPIS